MSTGDHYTARVGARAELAAIIKREHLAAAQAEGLTEDDLDVLSTQGEAAKTADREQREELARIDAQRSGRRLEAADIFGREDKMRNRLLAVIADLLAPEPELSRWLSRLSFARYRFREITPPAGGEAAGGEADADIKRVERVEREDVPTRLAALANFCTALLQPGREAIVERFAARSFPRDAIEQLGEDADALAKQGRNAWRAAAATEREARAARAARERWEHVRRMVRNVAQTVPELKTKFAEC